LALESKKEKHLANLNKLDAQDQFEITIIKWKKMSKYVMNLGSAIHLKNGLMYKGKWCSIFETKRESMITWQLLDITKNIGP
jgi:hypothetical protein